ncbi:MAG: Inner membrane protein YejM [Planctomycetes bacterium ADurb.Bin401]|nr:MAG: Inner membrane protein YejM [Planctomycetes bacterium ADurb.Bin401]
MKKSKEPVSILAHYFAISYLLLLINLSVFLKEVSFINFRTWIFTSAVYFAYCFIYLLPFFLALNFLRKALLKFSTPVFFKSCWFTGTLAIFSVTFVQLLIYTDSYIFRMFGFHFNSFVLNLIFTKGGIESMGSTSSTVRSFILVLVSIISVQAAVWILLIKSSRIKKIIERILTRPRLAFAFSVLVILVLLQGLTYGISSFYSYRPILTASRAFPFYTPVTFKRIAKSFGFTPPAEKSFSMKFREINLRYPLKPIVRNNEYKKYNIVFLMAESLRSDMLNPKIMPKTWAFAQKSIRFNHHYSGGNGTRMGVFSAFYGLYGNYWFDFLEECKGPLLVDILIKDNYQISAYSSAKFSYPEFEKTVFSRLSSSQLHDSTEIDSGMLGWKLDRVNAERMIDFMQTRDKSRPFMTFMFFESPHAPYFFPRENEIARPYLEEFDYADVDIKKNIKLIKNRYINSCNHLDSQVAKVFKFLEDSSLLDSTIVILTGDHGEEFMEKGRWGHNSNYSEEQTRVPLVLWVPGKSPRQISDITSHLDIPATLLKLLGVTNPPQDYSEGIDLLGDEERKFTVVSGWDTIAYIDYEDKAIFPINVLGDQIVTTKTDKIVANETPFFQNHQPFLIDIMKDMSRFSN